MSKYSLKKEYRSILKEANNPSANVTNLGSVGDSSVMSRYSVNVGGKTIEFISGKLSSKAMEIFKTKFGSQGRGEFSFVLDVYGAGGYDLSKDEVVDSTIKTRHEIEDYIKKNYKINFNTSTFENFYNHLTNNLKKGEPRVTTFVTYASNLKNRKGDDSYNFVKYFKDYDRLISSFDLGNLLGNKTSIDNLIVSIKNALHLSDKDKVNFIDKDKFRAKPNDKHKDYKTNQKIIDDFYTHHYANFDTESLKYVLLNYDALKLQLKADKTWKTKEYLMVLNFNGLTAKSLKFKSSQNIIKDLENYLKKIACIKKIKLLKEEVKEKINNDDRIISKVFKAVTTSGTDSMSTDIVIKRRDLISKCPKGKQVFNVFKNKNDKSFSVEIKEAKNAAHIRSDGIRLGGGSRLAVLSGDTIFALTTLAIAADINPMPNNEMSELLDMIKRGEIGKEKFIILMDKIVEEDAATELTNMINSLTTKMSSDRRAIVDNCISIIQNNIQRITAELQKNNKNAKYDKSKGKEALMKELSQSMDNAIKADWFLLINSSKNKYVMIKKEDYPLLLSTAKISNSGLGYAKLENSDIISLLESSNNKGKILSNNFDKFESLHSKRKNFLNEIKKEFSKKKLVKEGGLGGHMRHPYENLDITPKDMMDRIESYGVPQTVIDKVDGQNLFFTVERDGTLLFARNKQDMTHQDLVDKFTGHGAEAAFLEGGEAIKSGVEQWLNSAGNFAEQEILDIFHPTEDIRSFINFEIMHPKNSNQIQYDRKYIVFHSIVDFGEGRSQIFSSNQDERLKKLIGLMNSGVASSGFELASNREIDLNTLSNVQIMVYTDRIRDLIYELEMDEDEFLADGILRIIDKELAQEGISLEENTLKIMRDFVLYGEDSAGDAITSRDFTKHVSKEDAKKLRALGLTNAAKAKAKVAKILSPFKEIFVDLGIDLLKGVKSAYLSPEKSDENIEMLRDKLATAIEDYDQYIMTTPEDELSKVALRLEPHVDKIKQVGIDKAVSTSVEGGVYTHDLDLEKITGGFAPLNQIVGAAYRDKEGIFPNFQNKFLKESKKYSLKNVFKL